MTQIKSTGGILPIPAAATQKNAPAKKAPKPPAPRLKLLVRRLPPGLTEDGFRNAVGEEWMVGAGKVDWFQYRPGKVSKDPAKPSRPSRAYIHVVSSDHIAPLADKVRQSSFLDAQNTANDPVLLGPPSVEFAPYAKIPGNRVRKDARQGTIDQDPDFFAFLESLTQPVTKPSAESTQPEEKETMTTTPLVQYIKDKKANKAKEQTAAKSSRKSEKEAKPEKAQAKKLLQRPDRETAPATERTEKKSKSDKATKEAVKAANKAANVAAKQSGRATPTGKETPTAPASERKRERGNAAAAAKILQRDLGLSSSGGRRKGGKGGSEVDAKKENVPSTPTEPSKKETAKPPKQPKGKASETTPQPSEPSPPQPQPTPPPSAPAASTKPAKPSKGKQPAASASATATQAFLKHANPSQGVTEPLLETAFSPFGQVVSVEIDKKKGFGYVDFAEPSGLQKAIAASPVMVAQSQVVVLERKTNPGGDKPRKGRGGGAAGGVEQAAANSGNGNNNGSARGGKPEGSGGGGSSRGRGGRGRNRGGNKGEKERA